MFYPPIIYPPIVITSDQISNGCCGMADTIVMRQKYEQRVSVTPWSEVGKSFPVDDEVMVMVMVNERTMNKNIMREVAMKEVMKGDMMKMKEGR